MEPIKVPKGKKKSAEKKKRNRNACSGYFSARGVRNGRSGAALNRGNRLETVQRGERIF